MHVSIFKVAVLTRWNSKKFITLILFLTAILGHCFFLYLMSFVLFHSTVHYNGYVEFNDEPYDSSRLRGRPDVKKLGEWTKSST